MADFFTHTESDRERVIKHIHADIQQRRFRPRIAPRLHARHGFLKAELISFHDVVFYPSFGKRFLDLSLVILTAPFVFIISMIIAVIVAQDGGAPFYRHWRVGKNGKAFGCLKVRTMTTDATERLKSLLENNADAALEWKETHKLRNDPRITKIGKFLRKTSLDELPQLWNVFIGEMSLVGPRPVTLEELDRFGSNSNAYKSVRPGITGPWQINPTRNVMTYDERVEVESSYATQVSFMGDMKVLFGTLKWAMAPNGR